MGSRIIETDSKTEGFNKALGENVVIFCGVYIYAGKLLYNNEDHISLGDAVLVYETGELLEGAWKDAQKLPSKEWNLQKAGIESWGLSGR